MYTPLNQSEPLGILDLLPSMPYDCATAYLSLMCPTFFRPCTPPDSQSGIPYALMTPVCYSECIHVNEVCASFFQDRPLNCSQADPLTGYQQWPNASQLTPPSICLTISQLPATPYGPSYVCPPPLIFAAPLLHPKQTPTLDFPVLLRVTSN